jgi:hypothetical protein
MCKEESILRAKTKFLAKYHADEEFRNKVKLAATANGKKYRDEYRALKAAAKLQTP